MRSRSTTNFTGSPAVPIASALNVGEVASVVTFVPFGLNLRRERNKQNTRSVSFAAYFERKGQDLEQQERQPHLRDRRRHDEVRQAGHEGGRLPRVGDRGRGKGTRRRRDLLRRRGAGIRRLLLRR